ncbi:MAG: hypothetical protein Q8835_02715, partial [Sweet potato little leaf phytoplasma]|nr:hypothetical protein [Sweet potato little leaf phytoplasma]
VIKYVYNERDKDFTKCAFYYYNKEGQLIKKKYFNDIDKLLCRAKQSSLFPAEPNTFSVILTRQSPFGAVDLITIFKLFSWSGPSC